MNTNFLAKYVNDSSDSSDSDDNFSKDIFRVSLSPSSYDPSPKSQPRTAATPLNYNNNTIVPYTFDPKSVLEKSSSFNNSFNTDQKTKVESKKDEAKGKYKEDKKVLILKSSLKSGKKKPKSVSFNFADDDPYECRRTDEYKKFLKVFDKEQETTNEAFKRLNDRVIFCAKELETIMKELGNNNFNLALLRKHLQGEVGTVKNEVREMINDLLLLSNERKILRDQYCVLQARYEFLKNPKKPLQEECVP